MQIRSINCAEGKDNGFLLSGGTSGLVNVLKSTPRELFFLQLLPILDSWLMKKDLRSKQQKML